MLVFDLSNTATAIREGITCYRCASTITAPESLITLDTCFCEFECDYPLLVFADNSLTASERTKDYFTLYYKSKDSTATVSFFIDDTELIDITHGESINNGFIVDFTKIYNTFGGGFYTLKININEFGSTFTREFKRFQVAPYSEMRADGTVKIKSIQSGLIESGFDFGSQKVPFHIRIEGIFGNKQKVNEFKKTPDSNYIDRQVHDRWWYEYEFKFNTNKYNFVNLMLDNMLAGDEVYFSDYNLDNMTTTNPFNNVMVREVETETNRVERTNTTQYVVKLEDAVKNNIKRPYIDPC